MPYFWVSGGDQSEFETAFQEDPSVTKAKLVDEIDEAILYRAEWTENVETIVYAYTEIGATILQATGRDEFWELQMRFDNREQVSEFQTYCDEHDISFELTKLYQQEEPMASAQYGLTPKQRQTMVRALEAGYYDVPQGITMTELARPLEISQQALSKRLHHGHKNLVTNALTVSHPDDKS
jgi:predicted DNA binding protein